MWRGGAAAGGGEGGWGGWGGGGGGVGRVGGVGLPRSPYPSLPPVVNRLWSMRLRRAGGAVLHEKIVHRPPTTAPHPPRFKAFGRGRVPSPKTIQHAARVGGP